jgi:hypothetical protein
MQCCERVVWVLDIASDLGAECCAGWRRFKDVSDAGLALAKAVNRGKIFDSPETGELPVKTLFGFQGQGRFQRRRTGQILKSAHCANGLIRSLMP